MIITVKYLGISLWFFIKYVELQSGVITSENNIPTTHYTLTLGNIQTKIFSPICEENESKKVLIVFLLM